MIVTIQREIGAGGLAIGEALAREISAALLDERTLIADLCARGGFSAEYLQSIQEAPPSFANTFMHDLARATALVQAMEWKSTEETVLREIRALVLERATQGHVVLIGQGGSKLLAGSIPAHDLFSIFLHARREWRIEQVMQRFTWHREEATERVRRTDDLRRKYLQHFFSADLYDARTYDLVIDTERIGVDAAIALACTALQAAMAAVSH